MTNNTPTWLDSREYPFEPRTYATEQGNLHYIDVGQGDPIVFVHGTPDWSFLYRNIIKGLSNNYRCIAVDHLGFGLSDKPTNGDYSPQAHADRLEKLIESLNLTNTTLVMNDWGGPIGFSYAVKHPEAIKSLMVMNSWAWPVNHDWYYQMFSAFMGGPIGRFMIKHLNAFPKMVIPMSYGKKAKYTPTMRRHLEKPFEDSKNRTAMVGLPKAITKETTWLEGNWSQRGVLAQKPLLIVWGLKDIAFRKKELGKWAQFFPQAEVRTFEDAGHYPHEEYPQETLKIFQDFLQNISSRR